MLTSKKLNARNRNQVLVSLASSKKVSQLSCLALIFLRVLQVPCFSGTFYSCFINSALHPFLH
ncbi:hypothetical protein V5799_025809, partial [Amblyomma americanum]